MSFPQKRKQIREGLGFKTSKTDKEMYKKFFFCKDGASSYSCMVVVPKNGELIYWRASGSYGLKDIIERLKPLFNGGTFEDRHFYKFSMNETYFFLNHEEIEDSGEIFNVLNSRFKQPNFIPNNFSTWVTEVEFAPIKERIEKGIINPIHWEQL